MEKRREREGKNQNFFFVRLSFSAVRKAWDDRKRESAKKAAREKKNADAEKKRIEDEKAAEKLANEKLVAKYREKKK